MTASKGGFAWPDLACQLQKIGPWRRSVRNHIAFLVSITDRDSQRRRGVDTRLNEGAMILSIVKRIGRGVVFETITGFERDAFGQSHSAAEINRIRVTAALRFLKTIIAESILEQDPRRLPAEPETITQAEQRAGIDLVERTESVPNFAAQVGRDVQAKIVRQLKPIADTDIASPGPIGSHIGRAFGIRQVAVEKRTG